LTKRFDILSAFELLAYKNPLPFLISLLIRIRILFLYFIFIFRLVTLRQWRSQYTLIWGLEPPPRIFFEVLYNGQSHGREGKKRKISVKFNKKS